MEQKYNAMEDCSNCLYILEMTCYEDGPEGRHEFRHKRQLEQFFPNRLNRWNTNWQTIRKNIFLIHVINRVNWIQIMATIHGIIIFL